MIDIYNRLGSDQTYIPQVETEDGMEQILSQIKMILGTAPCDVLGAPYFGANIKKYLFNLSYNQQEITNFVTNIILTNIDYDRQKYSVDVNVEFGKDQYNKSDYAISNISINQIKCLGVMVSQ